MTASAPDRPRSGGVLDSAPVGVAAYYILLFAIAALLVRFVPGAGEFLNAPVADNLAPGLLGDGGRQGSVAEPVLLKGAAGVALAAVLVMLCAALLMLPVAWGYILTRQRKGFRQSVVQTLILLPVVVAGVAILVKNSVALAFSLGGIVGAVTFRNNLRDTKDAIYVFLAIGVGLAAGIQSMGVAAALSLGFNAAIFVLWTTDFGRVPAGLRGRPARLRLMRARQQPNRADTFVAEVDREILRSLAPEQLDALAERARRRRDKAVARLGETAVLARGEITENGAEAAPSAAGPAAGGAGRADDGRAERKPAHRLGLRVVGPVEPARHAIEGALERLVKRWEPLGARSDAAGGHRLDYAVRFRKRLPSERFVPALRDELGPFVVDVDLKPERPER